MLSQYPQNHDQSLDPLIQQILPQVFMSLSQIQQSLKKQLMVELQKQAQIQFQKQFMRIEEQAKQQYQLAIHDLQQEGHKLLQQQTQKLKKQVERLQKQKKLKQQAHLQHLQQQYISQNFQQLILNHEKIKQVEYQLSVQILESSSGKIQATKQRRMRELAVKMENREQKYRKDRDKIIRNQIYQSRTVQQIRKDLQIMKIGVASMKSEYNIKIKKIDNQIKQIKEKNKQLQPKQDINELRKQLQYIQTKRDQINSKILCQPVQIQDKNKINDTFSHLDSSSEYDMQPPHFKSLQNMVHRDADIVMEQNDYSEEQSDEEGQQYEQENSDQSENNYSNQYLVKPPTYSLEEDEPFHQNLKTFEHHAPILKLNVANLLRTNWQDPLQRYVNISQNNISIRNDSINHVNNENDSKVLNKSSFQQIYHQHLQKLNQATKRRKLSTQAKNTIMKNLSIMKKNKY